MFLGVSASLCRVEMTEQERAWLGELVQKQRTLRYGTKSAAYQAARINSATWDRLELGQTVREDRRVAAVKALWPESGGDWRRIEDPTAARGAATPVLATDVLGGSGDTGHVERIAHLVMDLQDRVASLERRMENTEPHREEREDDADSPAATKAAEGASAEIVTTRFQSTALSTPQAAGPQSPDAPEVSGQH